MLEDAVAIWRTIPTGRRAELMSGLNALGTLVHFAGDSQGGSACFAKAWRWGGGRGSVGVKVTNLMRHAELVTSFDRAPAKAEPLFRQALTMARAIIRAITRTRPAAWARWR